MKKITFIVSLFALVVAQAQTEQIDKIHVSNTKAVYLGSTGRLSSLISISKVSHEKRRKLKEAKKVQPNFFGRGLSKIKKPALEHQGPDPIRQLGFAKQRSKVAIDPIVNVEGLTNGSDPQDPTGAIGLGHYLQAINATDIGVYTKEGVLIQSFTGNTLWAPIGEISLGDPIILYDQAVNRWLITEFANPANLLVALSETSDPLGSYQVYSFSTPEFPDYPKYGIWNNAYVVTTNEGVASTLHQYFIDRSAMIAGEEDVAIQRVEILGNPNTEAGFYVSTPVDWNGSTAPPNELPMVVKINDSSWGEVAEDALEIFSFDIDFENPSNTMVTKRSLITTPFDGFPCAAPLSFNFSCIPQKEGPGLDGIPEVIMNVPHYRNFGTHESMVLNFITDATDGDNISGIRWMELRRTTGEWEIYQEGTFAPDDDLHRFMGSIAMDGNGNIGLAYNVSGEDEYVGIRFTGRLADDPLGVMTVIEREVVAGQNPIFSSGRFGDYAQMSVDPADDMTFWYTSEYAGNGVNDATTRIFSFQLERKELDLALTEFVGLEKSGFFDAEQLITIRAENVGKNPIDDFDVSLYLNDVLMATDNLSSELAPGASLQHTFSSSIDLTTVGQYDIRVELSSEVDQSEGNNMLRESIVSLYETDIELTGAFPSLLCRDKLEVETEIKNVGGKLLTAASMHIKIDDELYETIDWIGSLDTNESEEVLIEISDIPGGESQIAIEVVTSGDDVDGDLSNNKISSIVDVLAAFTELMLTIQPDNYPEETSWQLVNSAEDIIATGGPYPELTEPLMQPICVEAGGCYTFTIFDSFGDGICCEFGLGSYSITSASGDILVSGDGQFVTSKTDNFCTDCTLEVEVNKTDQFRSDLGSISIDADNGVGVQYSIDGGATFSTNPEFENLAGGNYDVVVVSNDGNCTYSERVTIQHILGLEETNDAVDIWPNPTDGLFKISVKDETVRGFLVVEVLNAEGRVLQTRKFSRYDDRFTGSISLYAYESGVYFLRLVNGNENQNLFKVIKK